jgi:hypothetical protein
MRIAMVAPLYESVPPKLYGGTERVVSFLTEELVRLGMDVTLFASGDSVTDARLRPGTPQGLRLDPNCHDRLAPHFAMIHDVMESADEFDVVHFHLDYLHFPMSRALGLTQVTTLHGRLDLPELARSTAASTTCRSSRFPMRSASPSPSRTGRRRCTTGSRESPALQPAPRRLPRVPRADFAREASGPRDPHRARRRNGAAHRGQGG